MKLLLDMGVSHRTSDFLQAQGHNAVHVGRIGQARLADGGIVQLAASDERTIVTFDLDFSRIAALQRLDRPSIILFRLEHFTTDEINDRLLDLLVRFEAQLQSGAIVVVGPTQIRVRLLPIL